MIRIDYDPSPLPPPPDPDENLTKALSGAFGDRRKRRAQLVARLKRRRRYGRPVKGGAKTKPERKSSRFG